MKACNLLETFSTKWLWKRQSRTKRQLLKEKWKVLKPKQITFLKTRLNMKKIKTVTQTSTTMITSLKTLENKELLRWKPSKLKIQKTLLKGTDSIMRLLKNNFYLKWQVVDLLYSISSTRISKDARLLTCIWVKSQESILKLNSPGLMQKNAHSSFLNLTFKCSLLSFASVMVSQLIELSVSKKLADKMNSQLSSWPWD